MNKIIIKSLIIVSMLFVSDKLYSQFGLQLNYLNPTSTMAYYFKPTLGIEVFHKFNDEEDKFVMGTYLGYYPLNARLDTFQIYQLNVNNGNNVLYPGYMIYSKFFVVELGLTSEYRFFYTKLTPLVGLDLNINLQSYDYEKVIENTLSKTSIGEESFGIAITPRVGIRYELNLNLAITAGVGKNIGLLSVTEPFSYWKTFASIIFLY